MPKPSMSKAQWIRENDLSGKTPSAELIAKARREGITLTANQVYTARSEAKRRAAKSPPQQAPSAPFFPSGGTSPGGTSPLLNLNTAALEAFIRSIVRDEMGSIVRDDIQAFYTDLANRLKTR